MKLNLQNHRCCFSCFVQRRRICRQQCPTIHLITVTKTTNTAKNGANPASEAEGEKVMKHAAYRSGVHYTNVNRMPGNVDRNGVKNRTG